MRRLRTKLGAEGLIIVRGVGWRLTGLKMEGEKGVTGEGQGHDLGVVELVGPGGGWAYAFAHEIAAVTCVPVYRAHLTQCSP